MRLLSDKLRRCLSRNSSRLLRNAGLLFVGNTSASFLGFLTLAIAARALEPNEFGVLVLVQTYVMIVDQLVNFQSWQAVIKYGAEALHHDGSREFEKIIKFGTFIDVGTAVLGLIVALSAIGLIGGMFGWDSNIQTMAQVYSISIVFNIAGTPTGILRIMDRFGLISLQRVASEAFRLFGTVVALVAGSGVWGFLVVWTGSTVLGYLLLTAMAWGELRRNGYGHFLTVSLHGISEKHLGLWSFVWTTNINSSVRMASRHFDMLLVGGTLGAAAAGLYKIAKQLSSVLGQLSSPFYQAIYPELAKLWAAREYQEFSKLALRSGLSATVGACICWIGFLLIGKWILSFVFGVDYASAFAITIVYMFATVIAVGGFPLQPVMLAMGRPHLSFWVHLGSTLVYLPILLWCLHSFGLLGAGFAYVAYYLIWSGIMLFLEIRLLRQPVHLASPLVVANIK